MNSPRAAPRTPRPARRGAWLSQLLFVLVAAATAGIAFADHLPVVVAALAEIGALRTAIACVLVLLGLLATAQMWRANLAALGHRLPAGPVHRVFFPAQVGKYLPGAVWPYLAQLRLMRGHGVPARATLTASAMFLAMHVSTGIALGAALLAGIGAVTEQVWWSLLLVAPALTLLQPRVAGWIAGRLPGSGASAAEPGSGASAAEPGSGAIAPALGWLDMARPAGWMLLGWLGYGTAAFAVLTPFASGTRLLPVGAAGMGAFAVGWVVGLVTIVAPAGIGAREATFALLLAPLVGAAPAVAVALLLRLCHLAADVALAVCFGIADLRQWRRIETGGQDGDESGRAALDVGEPGPDRSAVGRADRPGSPARRLEC
jgi:glycosyltransferase 2 family protein